MSPELTDWYAAKVARLFTYRYGTKIWFRGVGCRRNSRDNLVIVVYHDAGIDHVAAKQLGMPVTKFLGHPVERVVGTAPPALHW